MRYWIVCLLFSTFCSPLLAQSASEEPATKARVRIYDARDPLSKTPVVGVYLNDFRATASSRGGKITSWGLMPSGSYSITLKDKATGNAVGSHSVANLSPDFFTTLIVYEKEGGLGVIAVSVSKKTMDETIKKDPSLTLLVPVNTSQSTDYTLSVTNGDPPSSHDIDLKSGAWQIVPVTMNPLDWKLKFVAGKTQGEIPAGRFPPASLMAGHVAVLLLADDGGKGPIITLDGSGGGFLAKDE